MDLGLPSGLKWAKCNLGANVPESAGLYFSWGNTDGHPAGSDYNFSQDVYDASPAASISANLTVEQDAARQNLGGIWRMPTRNDFVELSNPEYTEYVDTNGNVISGTDKRTTYNGVVGLLFRSKANGNTLFLPAAGFYNNTNLDSKNSRGYYWSSSYLSASDAYRLSFFSDGVSPQHYLNRHYGLSVRAVQDGTPNRSIVPPTPEKDEETPTTEEPKDKDER